MSGAMGPPTGRCEGSVRSGGWDDGLVVVPGVRSIWGHRRKGDVSDGTVVVGPQKRRLNNAGGPM